MTDTPIDRLCAVGRAADEAIDLAQCGLDLARVGLWHERAGVDPAPYLRHLAALTEAVADYAGPDPAAADLDLRREALTQVIARRYGYGAGAADEEDVFEDMEAANLMAVIDRRRGLPVALGLIYMAVCHDLGWLMTGIDFPGRFLVRLEGPGADGRPGQVILDLFDDCRVLAPPDLRELYKTIAGPEAEVDPLAFVAMPRRSVLLRLQNNIRLRQMKAGDLAGAAETLETMVWIDPGEANLWREVGLVNARLDRIQAAVTALEEYLRLGAADAVDADQDRYDVSVLLQELRARLN